jgi:hypothetical protein
VAVLSIKLIPVTCKKTYPKNLKSVSFAGRVSQMQERNIKLLMVTNLTHVNLYHGRITSFQSARIMWLPMRFYLVGRYISTDKIQSSAQRRTFAIMKLVQQIHFKMLNLSE